MELLNAIWEKFKAAILDGSIRLDRNFIECQMCLNSGWTETSRTFYGRQYRGVIKCQACDYWHKNEYVDRAA